MLNILPASTQSRGSRSSYSYIPILIRHYLFVWMPPINILLFSTLPILFFSIFGLGQSYSDKLIGRGTVSALIMLNMAQYGVIFLAAAATARIGTERAQGWLRQMALSPVSPFIYNCARVCGSLALCAVVGISLYVYGFAMGVRMEFVALWQSYLILMGTVLLGALIGLFCGLLIPSDAAQGLVGGLSSLLSFFGGMFVPLDQMGSFFQTIGPWTPLWGASRLVQLSIEGWNGFPTKPILNFVLWILFLGVFSLLLSRRSTCR